jgi:hypothetical protein
MPAVFLPLETVPEAGAGVLPCDGVGGAVGDPQARDRTAAPARIEVRLPAGACVVIEGAAEPMPLILQGQLSGALYRA